MKPTNLSSFILFFLIAGTIALCQEHPKVQLPTTIVREIESSFVEDMTYELFIDLPPSYQTTEKTYPVVYLLDGYETSGLMILVLILIRLSSVW